MISPDQIIKKYRVTEKATELSSERNQYTFEASLDANRRQIAWAVKKIFDVEVQAVNIINTKGKLKRSRNNRGRAGRTPRMKKAIVTLAKGDTISLV